MLFSVLKHNFDLNVTDTALKVSRSLYCFMVLKTISPGCGVWSSLMLFSFNHIITNTVEIFCVFVVDLSTHTLLFSLFYGT